MDMYRKKKEIIEGNMRSHSVESRTSNSEVTLQLPQKEVKKQEVPLVPQQVQAQQVVQEQQPEIKQSKKDKKLKKLITAEKLDLLRSEFKKEIADSSSNNLIMTALNSMSKIGEDLKDHKKIVEVKHDTIDQKMIELEERLGVIESMVDDE